MTKEIYITLLHAVNLRVEFLKVVIADIPNSSILKEELQQLEVAQFWLLNNKPVVGNGQ